MIQADKGAIQSKIHGIQHLGIMVDDVEESIHFYEDKFGFSLIEKKIVIDSTSGALDVAFVQLGDCVLELFKKAGTLTETSKRSSGRLDHFALDAPDFYECAKKIEANNVSLDSSTPDGCVMYEHVGKCGVRGINFAGPNGEVIELCHDYATEYGNKQGILGWSHLAIKVESLDRSVSFYESLGFVKTSEGYLDTPDGRLIIGFVELNGFVMELIQMHEKGMQDLLNKKDGVIDHFALDVQQIDDLFLLMKKSGFSMECSMVKELALFDYGIKYFMIKGPDGELVEFNQRGGNRHV